MPRWERRPSLESGAPRRWSRQPRWRARWPRGAAGATLYKWTDANGRVVYSDQPPAGNVKVEIVGGAAPPDNPNAARDLANKDVEMKKAQRERAEESAKTGKARADAVKARRDLRPGPRRRPDVPVGKRDSRSTG